MLIFLWKSIQICFFSEFHVHFLLVLLLNFLNVSLKFCKQFLIVLEEPFLKIQELNISWKPLQSFIVDVICKLQQVSNKCLFLQLAREMWEVSRLVQVWNTTTDVLFRGRGALKVCLILEVNVFGSILFDLLLELSQILQFCFCLTNKLII